MKVNWQKDLNPFNKHLSFHLHAWDVRINYILKRAQISLLEFISNYLPASPIIHQLDVPQSSHWTRVVSHHKCMNSITPTKDALAQLNFHKHIV